jgi:nitroreductase
MATFDLTQVDHLLTTTRAVRKRLDLERPVEPETLTECLRLATYAPSASNTQLWRWVVVTDADTRAEIAAYYKRAFDTYARAGASGPPKEGQEPEKAPDPAMQRIYSASAYLVENLHRVPVQIIPCYLERPDVEAGNIALTSMYGSILQAVWSLQLALRSRGLGSVWTTLHLFYEQEVAALLGIPECVTQVAMLPVAYTIGGDFSPPPRRPVEEVTYWDRWDQTG